MKKQLPLLAIFLLLSVTLVFAQDKSSNDSADSQAINRAQSVYFEILGPGVTYSFNYDTRFQNTLDGLGGRIGFGLIVVDGSSLVTVPAMINYLLGDKGKYFELGLGATYINFGDDDFLVDEESDVIGTMVFGYRSQPVDRGFMFRAGFAPIISQGSFIPYYPYLSLGYTF